jgi:hypothetical protein
MRVWIIAMGCLLCGSAAAETFPYKATVTSLNVTARSGASFGTYPTERLAKHSRVEVLQEGASGWVAIAPPKDAFDWLPAAAVKLADDQTGEVIVASAAAYIGSNVRKIEKHVSQSDLKRGDKVRVLAIKGSWLKIAPPKGEVRWVQEKHLSTDSPEQLTAAETEERLAREDRYRRENAENPPGLLADLLQGRDIAEAKRDESIERAQFLRRSRPPLLSRRPRESTPAKDPSPSSIEIENGKPSEVVGTDANSEASPRLGNPNPSPRISLEPEETPKKERVEPENKLTKDTPKPESAERDEPAIPKRPTVTASTQTPPIDSQEFKRRMTQLDVDLTAMVAEDSSKWDLTRLRQRAEELVELGPSPRERGKARLLLDRIAEFASTLPPSEAVTPRAEEAIAAAPAVKQPDFATRYDAVGYLMPIVGARPGMPQYQLTDKDGRSLSLVTPRPGINLNAYVKKRVGMYGQRGYVDSLKKPHLVAERVVDLEVQRR